MSEPFITKEITNKDIYAELMRQGEEQKEILAHAKETNGRVTCLENRSIGHWIAEHPYKSSIMLTLIVVAVISDFRHPVIALLMKLF